MTMIQLIACAGMIAGLFMVLNISPREMSDSIFSTEKWFLLCGSLPEGRWKA